MGELSREIRRGRHYRAIDGCRVPIMSALLASDGKDDAGTVGQNGALAVLQSRSRAASSGPFRETVPATKSTTIRDEVLPVPRGRGMRRNPHDVSPVALEEVANGVRMRNLVGTQETTTKRKHQVPPRLSDVETTERAA